MVGSGTEGEGSRGKRESFGGEGTTLGFPGFSVKGQGSTVLVRTREDGTTVEMDVFGSAITGKDIGIKHFEKILNFLHQSNKLEFADFIEGISYQGFDRAAYIKSSLKKVSVSVFCRFAVLGAVRGSNFDKIKDTCLDMPADLASLVNSKTVIKNARRRDDMTILRFTASIPHWVAFWLFKAGVGKKVEGEECPAWLQFPGAASVPMSKELRLKHISFCKAFSALMPGGTFKASIYLTAFQNAIPENDIPSILKDHLGIGVEKKATMSFEEVRGNVTMSVVKA